MDMLDDLDLKKKKIRGGNRALMIMFDEIFHTVLKIFHELNLYFIAI